MSESTADTTPDLTCVCEMDALTGPGVSVAASV